MFVKGKIYPTICLPKTGKITPTIKAQYRRDFSMLLYSEDPEIRLFAKELFMYSYYLDGFNYGKDSYGTYLGSEYWNAFPEAVNMLRTFRERSDYTDLVERFRDQYLANHYLNYSQDRFIK